MQLVERHCNVLCCFLSGYVHVCLCVLRVVHSGCAGFEEASLHHNAHERMYIRNRKGFIKYCLQYGYTIVPTYVFGERLTFWNPPGFEKLKLRLNNFGLPAVFPIGQWYPIVLPFLLFCLPCSSESFPLPVPCCILASAFYVSAPALSHPILLGQDNKLQWVRCCSSPLPLSKCHWLNCEIDEVQIDWPWLLP